MRARSRWVFGTIIGFLSLLTVVMGVLLYWLLPAYASVAARQVVGSGYSVAESRFRWPDAMELDGIRLDPVPANGGASVRRATIRFRSVDWRDRVIRVGVHLQDPALRVTHRTQGFAPLPAAPFKDAPLRLEVSGFPVPLVRVEQWLSGWSLTVEAVSVSGGVVEWVDELPSGVFRGLLQHVFVTVSPPRRYLRAAGGLSARAFDQPLSFAARGEAVGAGGNSAPVYCSGWLDFPRRDIEASCRFEPIAVAAFEPYYQQIGKVRVRLYDTTVGGTARWVAQSNRLDGRFQLELDHLTQGDISVRGRTILNLGQLMRENRGKFMSEIRVIGSLDAPEGWQWECLPGTDLVQRQIRSRFDQATQVIGFRVLGQRFGLVLLPVTQEFAETIRRASDEIQQALEVVSSPVLDEVRRAVSGASRSDAGPDPEAAPLPLGLPESGSLSVQESLPSVEEPLPPPAAAQPAAPVPALGG